MEKSQFQFIKKVIRKLLQTTVLFHFYQFVGKYLNNCFVMKPWFESDLISPRQSRFRPGDSCINQLLLINHEILSASDIGLKFKGYSLRSQKTLIKSDMLDWFTNCFKTVYVETCLLY